MHLSMFDCSPVQLSRCLSAQLYGVCRKHSLVSENEAIAYTSATQFGSDRNILEDTTAMPTHIYRASELCAFTFFCDDGYRRLDHDRVQFSYLLYLTIRSSYVCKTLRHYGGEGDGIIQHCGNREKLDYDEEKHFCNNVKQ